MKLIFLNTQILVFVSFSDDDWAGMIDNERSKSGFYFNLNEFTEAINWGCKVQKTLTISFPVADFNSVSEAIRKGFRRKKIPEIFCVCCF